VSALVCARCGKAITRGDGIGTGYGVTRDGLKYCYACCGEMDAAEMIATGRATLYLTHPGAHGSASVGNWPDTLRFPVHYVKRGRHNMARWRYDFRFTGPDGKEWYGVTYGDNTQLAHCRRLKDAGAARVRVR
jgi:hypothetical protein